MNTPTQNPPNGLIPFQFQTNTLRVISDENGDPWFVAMDVAAILDYSETEKMTRRLDDDEKSISQIGGLGPKTGGKGIVLISESGLYEAIFGSNKPEAKAFKKWVKTEVLPSIRKTGVYAKPTPSCKPSSLLIHFHPDGSLSHTQIIQPGYRVMTTEQFCEAIEHGGYVILPKDVAALVQSAATALNGLLDTKPVRTAIPPDITPAPCGAPKPYHSPVAILPVLGELLKEWHHALGSISVTLREAYALITARGEGANEFCRLLNQLSEEGNPRKLARLAIWFRMHQNKPIGGYTIIAEGKNHQARIWRVEAVRD